MIDGNAPVGQHHPPFTFTRQWLHNAGSTCATDWIVREFELAGHILQRPRCLTCTYELSASAGLCWRCGSSQKAVP